MKSNQLVFIYSNKCFIASMVVMIKIRYQMMERFEMARFIKFYLFKHLCWILRRNKDYFVKITNSLPRLQRFTLYYGPATLMEMNGDRQFCREDNMSPVICKITIRNVWEEAFWCKRANLLYWLFMHSRDKIEWEKCFCPLHRGLHIQPK